MFKHLPLPAEQDVHDSSGGVTPCFVMKNDGVLYHQVSLFSLEHRMKVVLQERSVIGSVYHIYVEVSEAYVKTGLNTFHRLYFTLDGYTSIPN